MIDVTAEAEKPFVIRSIWVTISDEEVVHTTHTPMATIEECREAIAYAKQTAERNRAQVLAQRETAEYQEYREQVLERFGHDVFEDHDDQKRYAICRIAYEEIEIL